MIKPAGNFRFGQIFWRINEKHHFLCSVKISKFEKSCIRITPKIIMLSNLGCTLNKHYANTDNDTAKNMQNGIIGHNGIISQGIIWVSENPYCRIFCLVWLLKCHTPTLKEYIGQINEQKQDTYKGLFFSIHTYSH